MTTSPRLRTTRARATGAALTLALVAGPGHAPSTRARAAPTLPATVTTSAPVRPDDVTATSAGYRTPVPGRVLRAFDPPAVRWSAGHRGVDLAAAIGDPVRAPADGVVTFAGTVAGRGVLTVLHDDGLRSSFEPVIPAVRTGQRVRRGEEVATLDDAAPGTGHCDPASCLHWGVRRGEAYVDPMALVSTDPIVLLPLR